MNFLWCQCVQSYSEVVKDLEGSGGLFMPGDEITRLGNSDFLMLQDGVRPHHLKGFVEPKTGESFSDYKQRADLLIAASKKGAPSASQQKAASSNKVPSKKASSNIKMLSLSDFHMLTSGLPLFGEVEDYVEPKPGETFSDYQNRVTLLRRASEAAEKNAPPSQPRAAPSFVLLSKYTGKEQIEIRPMIGFSSIQIYIPYLGDHMSNEKKVLEKLEEDLEKLGSQILEAIYSVSKPEDTKLHRAKPALLDVSTNGLMISCAFPPEISQKKQLDGIVGAVHAMLSQKENAGLIKSLCIDPTIAIMKSTSPRSHKLERVKVDGVLQKTLARLRLLNEKKTPTQPRKF